MGGGLGEVCLSLPCHVLLNNLSSLVSSVLLCNTIRLWCLNRKKNSIILRTQLSVRVHACIGTLLTVLRVFCWWCWQFCCCQHLYYGISNRPQSHCFGLTNAWTLSLLSNFEIKVRSVVFSWVILWFIMRNYTVIDLGWRQLYFVHGPLGCDYAACTRTDMGRGGGEGVSASVVVSVSFGVTGLGTHVAEK